MEKQERKHWFLQSQDVTFMPLGSKANLDHQWISCMNSHCASFPVVS